MCEDCEEADAIERSKLVICKACKTSVFVDKIVVNACWNCVDKYRRCSKCNATLIKACCDADHHLCQGKPKPECTKCANAGFVCKEPNCNAPDHFKMRGIDGYCKYHSCCHKCGLSIATNQGKWEVSTDAPTAVRNGLCKYCAL